MAMLISHPAGVPSSQLTWTNVVSMPVNASSEPTDRSIWRATITNTMPHEITAIADAWTERLYRLRGERNNPSVRTSSAIQIPARASSMDTMRGSRPRPRRCGFDCGFDSARGGVAFIGARPSSGYLQAFGALAAATPLQTCALVAQPAV